MRGEDLRQGSMFSYISLEERIPADHPLRQAGKVPASSRQERYQNSSWRSASRSSSDLHGGRALNAQDLFLRGCEEIVPTGV